MSSTQTPPRKRSRGKGRGEHVSITLRLSHEEWEQVHQIARMERRSLNDLAISRILQNDGGGKGVVDNQNFELSQRPSVAVSPEEEGSLPSSYKTVTEGGVPYPEEIAAAKGFKMAATEPEESPLTLALDAPPYTLAEALDGLFLTPEEFQEAIDQWRAKKNLILQGPPGVGKTYIAKRLAYYLIGSKDPERLKMIQFHQSYAYEDFIQGFRPVENGGFKRKNGVFYRFCKLAQKYPEQDFVFMIDEINRGNLSKIFGELFQLIERDKRGEEHAIPLTYSPEERFYLPTNLYVIGMMNTADRSLAMVDHALRRRFSFITLKPKFDATFAQYLKQKGAAADLIEKIISGMNALNDQIAEDTTSLGPGFCIGHSYFCPVDGEQPNESWHRAIISNEIKLLLEEYWFDNPTKADKLVETLL